MKGTEFHIVSSEPMDMSVKLEPRDGSARPTVLRQPKAAILKRGETASFQNLLYAENGSTPRKLDICKLGESAVMVRGRTDGFDEEAAMGTGRTPDLRSLPGEAALWYVSNGGIAAAGVTRLSLPGAPALTSSSRFNLLVMPQESHWTIENPTEAPIELAIADAKHRLPRGRHSIPVKLSKDYFDRVREELERKWETITPPEKERTDVHARLPDPFRELWRYEGIRPSFKKHCTIKATAEPKTVYDRPECWVDRRIHYSAPSDAWRGGPAGTVTLDLHREVDVRCLRIVGSMGAFAKDDMAFEIGLSNDRFERDVRRSTIETPAFETHHAEMLKYMYTYQFPVYVLPVNDRARQVRITPRPLNVKRGVYFHEIEVVTDQREASTNLRLFVDGFRDAGKPAVLAASQDRLVMLSVDGNVIWTQEAESPIANVSIADVNSDGRQDIVVFTLGEKLHVFDGDGRLHFTHDVRKGKVGGSTPHRPGAVGAWRPDERGNLEYYFMPHVRYGRIGPAPKLKQNVFRDRGGKYAFTVPDVTGDGREELAVVGLYGSGFGVIDSRSDLAEGGLRYVATHGLTGYNSGNMELPVYFDGAVVRAADGKWLGVAALNPGGINFYSAPRFDAAWSHFNHPPNTCYCLLDTTDDGIPELLVGRKDGFVVQYSVSDGTLSGRAHMGGDVRSIAGWRGGLLVGTSEGLVLMDTQMRRLGERQGPVQRVAATARPGRRSPLVIAANDDGTITGLELAAK